MTRKWIFSNKIDGLNKVTKIFYMGWAGVPKISGQMDVVADLTRHHYLFVYDF